MRKLILSSCMVFTFFAYFVSFAGNTSASDATLTLDDNAGSSAFVVQDSDKTNQFKVNSDGQGYFAGKVGIGTTGPTALLDVSSGTNNGVRINAASGYAALIFANSGTNKWIQYPDGDDMLFLDVAGGYANRVIFKSGGNVGIGTTNPSSKLTVAGTIESTSGGVKFPDGTTQTTATTSATTLKTYDSGWFAVSANSSYSKTHNLGTTKVLITIMISENSDGSGRCTLAYPFDYSVQGQCVMENLSTATISLRTHNTVVDMQNASGRWYSTSGYARIILLALE